MQKNTVLYFEFLKYCLDVHSSVPKNIDKMDWGGLYEFAVQQAISAIVFCGIERLKGNTTVPREIVLNWIVESEQIKQQNHLLNRRTNEIANKLRVDGFECCILKGQGNAMLYPDPFLRMPGDIDVWVRTKTGQGNRLRERINDIIAYSKINNPNSHADIIHVDYGNYGGVEVELHYWPTYMNSPIYNKRLHNWIRLQEEQVFNNKQILPDGEEINVPTTEFNLVYQLSHMYKHVVSEGLGLRQVIDYYYLLKTNAGANLDSIVNTLRKLGLMKFAGAIMYILHNVLGLEEKYLIVSIDKQRGEFLLSEILRGGNFGKYDTKEYIVKWKNPVGSWLRHFEHDVRLVRYFPSESLWEPVSRIYQHFWRKSYNKNKLQTI